MKNYYLILALAFLLVLPMVAGIQTLGTFEQGACIDLKQSCANCTYVTFTRVSQDGANARTLLQDLPTQKNGTIYNVTSCIISSEIGHYIVDWEADPDGTTTTGSIDYFVNPSGIEDNNSNIVFFIFMITFIYAINLFGFFGKNEIVTILGGMALLFLGVYIINNGVIVYRDDLTNYFAYITIAWGTISALWAAFSLMDIF